MVTTWLKMENTYIFCNVIEFFLWRKITKIEIWGLYSSFKLQMALAQSCKNTSTYLCKHPNTSIIKKRNWSLGCWSWWLFVLAWIALKVTNPWVTQNLGRKSAHVGLTMTVLVKVRMSSLMSTMLTRWWEELNVVEGCACSCFCPMRKPTSCIMVAKMLWITSWVPMCSLPWIQRKRWISKGSMGCVHMYWRILAIKGWGRLNCIRNTMVKTNKNNQKARKTCWIINQTFTLGLEHDKIRAWRL